jgi:imidazolonepropionase
MIRADLLVTNIGDLATMAEGPIPRTGSAMGRLGRLTDGVIGVEGGRFVFVGTRSSARGEVRLRGGGTSYDALGGSVVPGFVDPHTHALFAGDRHREAERKVQGASYTEIAREGGGLFATVRATRAATDAELLEGTTGRLRRMRAHGTTTAEVKSGYALNHAGELRLLRLIPTLARHSGLRLVPTFLGAHAVPPEFAGRPGQYIDTLIRRTLPEIGRRRLALFNDVFCEPGFFSPRDAERLLRAGEQLGLRAKIHAEEFVRSGGARVAVRVRAISADHMLAANDADRRAIARAGVTTVLLPVTPFASLANAKAVGRATIDAGGSVALGSDLSPNSWVESMPIVLAHAVYAAHLTPAEALTASTVNSAHALGLDGVAGTIAVGRDADFSVFATRSVEEIPYRVGTIPERVYRQGNCDSSR